MKDEYYKEIRELARELGIHPSEAEDAQEIADTWGLDIEEANELREML